MEEEWRVIEEVPNYSVSNLGNVRNDTTGKILKRVNDGRGYYRYCLTISPKKHVNRYEHQLIAKAFIPNPNNYIQIDHINRIKTDNRIENLRWCNDSENGRNKPKKSGFSSRYLGVCWDTKNKRWRSDIRINGKKKFIGTFSTEEEAFEAFRNFVLENNLNDFYNL